jgi:hypothetical protein
MWACHQGAAAAGGDLLLFTDADTWHRQDGLMRAVEFQQGRAAGMMSCLPFHAGGSLWERLLGPFHMLLLALTAPFAPPTQTRCFAIGQYLLFTRAAYDTLGGHAAVRGRWVEDLPLARRAVTLGVPYAVYDGPPLFSVRMYASLGEFVRGWRRNFRAGFEDSPRIAPVEAGLMIAALLGGGSPFASPLAFLVSVTTIAYLVARQGRFGRFSVLGPLCFPFAISLFCLVTALAAKDRLSGRAQQWKGRSFTPA